MTAGVVWFRRDLRLDDNPAWAAATAAHDEVVAVFVIEAALMNAAGAIRRDQLLAHLHALDDELRARGGGLVVRSGPAAPPSRVSSATVKHRPCTSTQTSHRSRPHVTRPPKNRSRCPFTLQRSHRARTGRGAHQEGHALPGLRSLLQDLVGHRPDPVAIWRCRPTGHDSRRPIPDPLGPVRQPPGETAAWDRLTAWLELAETTPKPVTCPLSMAPRTSPPT